MIDNIKVLEYNECLKTRGVHVGYVSAAGRAAAHRGVASYPAARALNSNYSYISFYLLSNIKETDLKGNIICPTTYKVKVFFYMDGHFKFYHFLIKYIYTIILFTLIII